MEQIYNWRKNKNDISLHNIEIGSIRETIGEHREQISICENDNRETPYYWVNQWVNNNLPSYSNSFEDSVSQGQYESKLWLNEKLEKFISMPELHIDIIGSWFGFPLIEMLANAFDIKQIDYMILMRIVIK